MVALKASRMNNMNSEQDGYNERELDYALERMTEDDHDVYDQETSIIKFFFHFLCIAADFVLKKARSILVENQSGKLQIAGQRYIRIDCLCRL